MPTKNPDVWASIWNWVALNMNSITSFFFTFIIAFLRIVYVSKERKCWRVLVECLLCGSLAVASESIFEYLSMPAKLSVALGAIIAMFGIDQVRSFAKNYVDKKVGKNE
ncbi:phage holin, lambda family [Ursidibacter arcticus]